MYLNVVFQYKTHYIEGKDGSHLPFVFNDIMGLEDGKSGARTQDITSAMKGCLREGHDVRKAFTVWL